MVYYNHYNFNLNHSRIL